MKKYLHNFKFLTLVLGLMLTASIVNAATRTASVTGNWNQTATWGGASVPVAGDDVIINSGITVTVTVNAACATITFPTGNVANSTINVNSGISLTVSGTITIPRAGSAGTTPINTLAVGAGIVNAGSVAFTSGGGNVRHQITISTGTLDVSGNVAGSAGNTSGTISMSGAGTIRVGGTIFSTTDGTLTVTTGTVEYDGAGNQNIEDFTYGNLSTSGGGIKSITAATTIGGNLTIGVGTTLDAATFTTTLGNASVVTVNGTLDFTSSTGLMRTGNNLNATLTMGSTGLLRTVDPLGIGPVANASLQTQGTGIWTTTSISTAGTVEYNAGVAQALTDRDYNNLTISTTAGTKTWTLSASRTVNGNVLINANAPLTLAGGQTLNVKGNWTKNSTGAFTQGTTLVNLNGSAVQSLRGSQALSFSNITFNNTIAGSVVAIIVDTMVTVTGTATFTDGIVSTSTTEFISFPAGSSVAGAGLNQATDASFVVGPVLKTGNTAFTFPVGALVTASGGGYMPLTITAPDNAADAFSCEYTRNNATLVQTNGFTAPILNVSRCDYWNLNETNDAGAATSISVTLTWDAGSPCNTNSFITNISGLTVARYNSGNSKWEQAGTGGPTATGNTTTGTVTRTGVTAFSPFSLGNTLDGANPLPVNFSDVKAFEKGTGVQIEWTNLTEKDVVTYTVERSANGRDFTPVSQIGSRSNQSDKQSYLSLDATPLSGTNYYRIKAVEIDGKIIYSKLLKVDIGRNVKGVSLYPNPVAGNDITIGFTAVKGQYTLRVINNAGQEVYSKQLVHPGGSISQSVELPASLKTGVYNLMISGDNYRETKMFIMK